MTSANRDGALIAKDPIRLYVSGGGNRATLGTVGAIAALVDLDEWQYVSEIVSVSGGSFPNAVLVAEGPADSGGDPVPALGAMIDRLRRDGMRPWATTRRLLVVTGALAVIATALAIVLVAAGAGPWSAPAWVGVTVGLLVVPITLLALRRLLAAGFRDVVTAVVGRNSATDLAATSPSRQHLFCAAGLSSGVPYTLWAGPKAPTINWGEGLHGHYTVGEAAIASSSLPGLGCVRAPRALGGETLVDGGVVGIFGQQTHDSMKRRARDAMRGEVRQFAIDAGRHSVDDGRFGRRLARVSTMYLLTRWLKVSLEATYVNDLDDAQGDTLIRLCWDPAMSPTSGELGPVLDAFARSTTTLGLFDVRTERALDAVVGGYARTYVTIRHAATAAEVTDRLELLGQRTGLDLAQRWQQQLGAVDQCPAPLVTHTNQAS